jgi:hypothetical protein
MQMAVRGETGSSVKFKVVYTQYFLAVLSFPELAV